MEPIKCMRSPTPQLQVERRRGVIRANQVYALATQQLQVEREREFIRANQVYGTRHTPATGGEERGIEPSSVCARHTPATGGE